MTRLPLIMVAGIGAFLSIAVAGLFVDIWPLQGFAALALFALAVLGGPSASTSLRVRAAQARTRARVVAWRQMRG